MNIAEGSEGQPVPCPPRVESITDESLESNCSMIENIPPKGVSFSDFIATFAMSCQSFACF